MRSELRRLERLLSRPGAVPTTSTPVAETSVDEVLRPLVVTFRERGQRLVWEPSGTVVRLDADSLARAVANLLGNALVHAAGATVTLRAEPYGSDVRLSVEDDGAGVPAGLRSTVFVSGSRGGPAAGDGLGLSVARSLARAAGGDCRLVGATGARFVLDLPAADLVVPVVPASPVVPSARGAR